MVESTQNPWLQGRCFPFFHFTFSHRSFLYSGSSRSKFVSYPFFPNHCLLSIIVHFRFVSGIIDTWMAGVSNSSVCVPYGFFFLSVLSLRDCLYISFCPYFCLSFVFACPSAWILKRFWRSQFDRCASRTKDTLKPPSLTSVFVFVSCWQFASVGGWIGGQTSA